MVVFDLLPACVLLAEAVHRALLVLGFKHFLVASKRLHFVGVGAHAFLGAAVDF